MSGVSGNGVGEIWDNYPFKVVVQPEIKMAGITGFLEEYLSKINLYTKKTEEKKYIITICSYIKYCAPKGASSFLLRNLAMFLVVFFFLNDWKYGKDKFNRIISSLMSILNDNHRDTSMMEPICQVLFDLKQNICVNSRKTGISSRYFENRINDMFQSFRWENSRRNRSEITLRIYSHIRERTIGVFPFFEIVKIDGNFFYKVDMDNEYIKKLEKKSVKIIYLLNDIGSTQKDKKKEKVNLMFVLKYNDRNLSNREAIYKIKEKHQKEIKRFIKIKRDILFQRVIKSRKYVDFLESIVKGNMKGIEGLPYRYNLD